MIYGQGMSATPQNFQVVFTSLQYAYSTAFWVKSQDNAFNSQTSAGKLQFTIPPASQIFNQPMSLFDPIEYLAFEISLIDTDPGTFEQTILKCPSTSSNCRLFINRDFTPILYYTVPQVVYDGSEIAFYVNPKSAQIYKTATDLFFEEARIDGYTIDFENFVDPSTTLGWSQKNQVRGMFYSGSVNASSYPNFKFTAGNAIHDEGQIVTCSYDNKTCYKEKVVPVIRSISASQGYTTGGQSLTVTGYGFNSPNIKVTIDGQDCVVKSFQQTQFTCETSANSNPSNDTYYVGTHGLKRSYFNTTTALNYTYMQTATPYTRLPALSLELSQNQKNGPSGNILKGYFQAPATGNYRFYMSCDDTCNLFLSNAAKDPSQNTSILEITSYTLYRDYLTTPSRVSSWVNLQASQFYYMEVWHVQGSGNDHLTVSVETDANTLYGHQHSKREIQRLQILPNQTREMSSFIVFNPSSCTIIINTLNPITLKYYSSPPFKGNTTAQDFKNAMAPFFMQVYGAPIDAFVTMYDANGNVTTDPSLTKKNVYTIITLKAVANVTIRYISPTIQQGCNTTMSFLPATAVQISSPPLKGNFLIQCTLPDNRVNTTVELLYNSTPSTIRDKIVQACPQYREKIEVLDGPLFSFPINPYSDGRDLIVKFSSYNGDPGQLRIINSQISPLVGNNITINNDTPYPYSTNLLYEPVPFDFLYTAESKPSLQVSVNDVPAVCNSDNLDCGYKYIQPPNLITAFSVNGNTLTIKGTNLPTNNLKSIQFGNNNCTWTSVNDTTIICTLTTTTTGDWKPIVKDDKGIVPVDPSVTLAKIPMTVTGVSPQILLNPMGDNILTINGTNFPPSLVDGSTINITLSDGTPCHVISSTPTQIKCLTDKFSSSIISVTGFVIVNNQTDKSLTLTIDTAPAIVIDMIPSIVSPVLKANITIYLNTSFAGTLDPDDLEVKFVKIGNSSIVKYFNVFAVNNTAKSITIKYGGAYSGNYSLSVKSKTLGKFDSDRVMLQAVGKVLDFQPRSGSIYGGTTIKITGYNYSTDIQDNPVRIGLTDCLVQDSTPSEITCITNPKRSDATNQNDLVEDFLVFLKTSEEALCEVSSGNCTFQWIDQNLLPAITSYNVAYNGLLYDYEIIIDGTDFPVINTSDIYFYIDGFRQPVLSVTSTQVKVRITNMLSSYSQNVQFYFPIGTPAGIDQILSQGITLYPVLISITPAIGSPAGTLLTANIRGVGINSPTMTIVKSDNSDICVYSNITSYGVLKCKTKPATFNDTLRTKESVNYQNCISLSDCAYQTSSSMPSVSAVSLSADKLSLILTGTGFFTSGFKAMVTYADIPADSVTVQSATQVTATWSKGFPLSNKNLYPVLWFENDSTAHWSSMTSQINNTASVTSIDANVQCSFAGGCLVSVSQLGLLSSLSNPKSRLTVCGQIAQLSANDSTNQQSKFVLPKLATTYSIKNYNISQDDYIFGTPFSSSSSAAQTNAPFDGDFMNGFTDTSKPKCYIGVGFTAGYIGYLSEVKYFMAQFKPSYYVNQLKFQGSMDNVTYTDIFTVGNEIHEGWNYYPFSGGQQLKFRYYRFYGNNSRACGLGEIGFRGVEVIDNNNNQYSTCPIQLTINDAATITLNGTITYTSTLTPFLTSISPRYGRVQGGEIITFTGTNFDSTIAKHSIQIDGITCVVQFANSTTVKCLTGKRPGLYPEPTLSFQVAGYGNVATQNLVFRYCNYWSLTQSWGNEFIPMEGDSIQIPKGLHLLVDVDSTPILGAIDVEGSLIFPPNDDPNHVRTFDARYIMVYGGYLEIGTEQFPYTSKLVITMHGDKLSPEIPIYGNKVIAVRHGILEMHGVPRKPTWTELNTTAYPGDSQIKLHAPVDWQPGERIVIAPTGYENDEAEEKTIVSVDRTNPNLPVITLDSPLVYKHYAAIETYGPHFIEMRAEVGLLTRNVIYRGDPETSSTNQFGAHIMLHSHGDESSVGRIEYCEFNDVGQAFQLGRYPIHFHLIGTVHQSYIRGNSIHNTYNRAVTIHAMQQKLRISYWKILLSRPKLHGVC